MSTLKGTIKRTTVRLDSNLHLLWKVEAAKQHINMDDYIVNALKNQLDKDKTSSNTSDEVIELRR